jgi:hypothetical protein
MEAGLNYTCWVWNIRSVGVNPWPGAAVICTPTNETLCGHGLGKDGVFCHIVTRVVRQPPRHRAWPWRWRSRRVCASERRRYEHHACKRRPHLYFSKRGRELSTPRHATRHATYWLLEPRPRSSLVQNLELGTWNRTAPVRVCKFVSIWNHAFEQSVLFCFRVDNLKATLSRTCVQEPHTSPSRRPSLINHDADRRDFSGRRCDGGGRSDVQRAGFGPGVCVRMCACVCRVGRWCGGPRVEVTRVVVFLQAAPMRPQRCAGGVAWVVWV